jgi:CubicO group peptidase (beta-lactamase class C family)
MSARICMLNDLLNGMIDSNLTPCATMAAMLGGRLVYGFAKGRSRLKGSAVAVDENTLFNVGSVTKPVTASLIVKLAEQGRLTLEDPVKKYVPEYPFDTITLLHLMTHTAGYDPSIDRDPHWKITPAGIGDFLKKIYSIDTLLYEPGSVSAYCTQYYTILMDIIQRVTGKGIEEFARETLFGPLGMERTTFDTRKLKDEELALPWKRLDEERFDYTRHNPPTGDSGLYATALELVKFAGLFLNEGAYGANQIFSKAAVRLMMSEATDGRHMKTPVFWYKGPGYCRSAFGDLNSSAAVCHPGFSGTLMMIDPQYDFAMVFITNSNDLHDDYSNFRKICNAAIASLV